MADPRLSQYIREQMEAGFGKEQIHKALLDAGWRKSDIDAAFFGIGGHERPAPLPPHPSQDTQAMEPGLPQKPGLFWKIRNGILHPSRLFEAVKPEGLEGAFIFTAVVYLVHFAIISILVLYLFSIFLPAINSLGAGSEVQMLFLFGPIMLVAYYFAALMGSFIQAAIIHLFVHLLKGGKDFTQTYKALMYSEAPMLLPWLALPLLFINALICVLVIALMFFITALWQLVLNVKGLSRLHSISTGKALAAILLPALIIVGVIVAAAVFAFGVFNPATYTGSAATGFGELGTPADWIYSSTTLTVTLKNSLSESITVTEVSSPSCTPDSAQRSISAGGRATFILAGCTKKIPGTSYSESLIVRYTKPSGLAHSVSGVLTGIAD
jgi:hypothetical protein